MRILVQIPTFNLTVCGPICPLARDLKRRIPWCREIAYLSQPHFRTQGTLSQTSKKTVFELFWKITLS